LNNDFLTIIPEGKYKGMRLYSEDKCGGEHVLPVEMYYLFQNAFKNNYKVFFFNCIPNHSIIIPKSDLEFLKKSMKYTSDEDEEEYLKYLFSNNTLKIKDLQYKDVLQIYNLAISNNNVGACFIHPELVNDYYCFHFFLIVNTNFNLEELLKIDFNIIKINSIIEYNENTITIELTKKIYNLLNLQFKDYIKSSLDISNTRPYNLFDLQEKKDLDVYYDVYFDFIKKNPNADVSSIRNKLDELKKKLSKKELELWDVALYKKLNFSKLCMQFYFFHEVILNDTVFFTNFIQLVNGVSVELDNGIKINYDSLYHYSLSDMFAYDDYRLFSVFERICY